MKQSIKIKLMRWIIPAVAISLILSVAITTKIVSDNDRELAVNNAKETAAKYSNDLNAKLVASLSSTNNFANNLSVYSSQNRTEVSLMVKNFVENNTQFLSSSLCYEPNAFDGNDKKYANQPYHDGTGRLIPYWIRGAGGITFDKLTGYEDAASDWYSVPKQTKQSYITQPLLYNGSLIVSFCSPIMKNGAFAGAAYGDMPLNFLDGVISKITLLKSGYAMLLSKQGVVLSAKDKSLIGVKSVKDLSDNGKNDLMAKLASSIEQGSETEFSSVDKETGNDVFVATSKVNTSGWFMVVIVPENEMLAGAHAVRNWLAIIGICIILLIAGAIYYITSKLTQPITDAQKLISELSKGHLGYKVQSKSNDEIGDIINDLEAFSQKLKTDFIDVVTDVANGNLHNEVKLIDERDEITPALIKTVNSLNGVMGEVKTLIGAAVAGNLHHRADDKKFAGVYNEIVSGMNKMLDTVVKPIDEGYNTLAVLATGDLTSRMSEEYDGDYRRIAESINSVADSFQNALNEVGGAIEATSSAANQISSSSEEMAAGVQESSSQTTEIASAVEEMTKTIYESAQNATNAAENSRLARDKATNGKAKVEETKQGMQKIVEATKVTGKIISSLSHRTDQIGQITQVIDEIADQTNLLALNAAIEAARAGEQGRGFAVVADEVRKLAERTTKATKEIANTIKTVQTEAKEADQSMAMADSSVKYGMELTEEVSFVLNEILEANQNVSELVSQLAASTEQQSATAEEISKNIDSISTVTNEAAHGTTQIAQAANDLSRLTERLQASISKFKLSKNNEIYGNQYGRNKRRFIETP